MEDLHGFAAVQMIEGETHGSRDPLQDAFVLGNPGGDHLVTQGTPHLDRVGAEGRSPGLLPLPLTQDPLLIDGLNIPWSTTFLVVEAGQLLLVDISITPALASKLPSCHLILGTLGCLQTELPSIATLMSLLQVCL